MKHGFYCTSVVAILILISANKVNVLTKQFLQVPGAA